MSLIRSRLYSYFIKNNYIKVDIQKGFWTEISGTIEHTETLAYMTNHARRYQKNLINTLLDLTSTFDELDHQPINLILGYHHVPHYISSLVGSFNVLCKLFCIGWNK